MIAAQPGDRVVYRDGDRFMVARIDLVHGRYFTAFPFDPINRRWSRKRRRIAADFVIGKLPPHEHTDRIARRIEALRNQREALRQQANRWLEDSVRQIATQQVTGL
jgi:hypothetical protein